MHTKLYNLYRYSLWKTLFINIFLKGYTYTQNPYTLCVPFLKKEMQFLFYLIIWLNLKIIISVITIKDLNQKIFTELVETKFLIKITLILSKEKLFRLLGKQISVNLTRKTRHLKGNTIKLLLLYEYYLNTKIHTLINKNQTFCANCIENIITTSHCNIIYQIFKINKKKYIPKFYLRNPFQILDKNH